MPQKGFFTQSAVVRSKLRRLVADQTTATKGETPATVRGPACALIGVDPLAHRSAPTDKQTKSLIDPGRSAQPPKATAPRPPPPQRNVPSTDSSRTTARKLRLMAEASMPADTS